MELICKCGTEISNENIKVCFEKSLCAGHYSDIVGKCVGCDAIYHLKTWPEVKTPNINEAKEKLVEYYKELTIKTTEG